MKKDIMAFFSTSLGGSCKMFQFGTLGEWMSPSNLMHTEIQNYVSLTWELMDYNYFYYY